MKKILIFCVIFIFSGFIHTPSKVYAEGPGEIKNEVLLEKIDQMIMVGFRGAEVQAGSDIKKILNETHVGGVILFDYDTPSKEYARNIASSRQVKKLTSDLQKGAKTPLLIAIDEEGGKVSRLKQRYGFRKILDTFKIMSSWSDKTLLIKAKAHGLYLKNLGFNVNFSPVVDLAVNPKNPVIVRFGRSFGVDSKKVVQKASVLIRGYSESKIQTSLKHYPGHGSSVADSHARFTDITKTYTQVEREPFRVLCKTTEVSMVMVGHMYDSTVDAEFPASLSKKHIQNLKGDGCGEKVVVSDDYDMKAIRDSYTLHDIVTKSINAGVDMLVFSNNIGEYDPDLFFKVRNEIYNAVENKEISKERIEEAYRKIQTIKPL